MKGFTIIEVTISIFVILIGVVGIYGLVPQIVRSTEINKNRFIASQLAREGIELVRNIRDTNWIEGAVSWKDGLLGCNTGCEIDYNDSNLSFYQGRYLRVDSNGLYNYEIGDPSKFRRRITVTDISTSTVQVDLDMEWSGVYGSLRVSEMLYDWK